jgi:hypothetical protein
MLLSLKWSARMFDQRICTGYVERIAKTASLAINAPLHPAFQARGEGADAELSQLNATLLSLKGPCARIA